MNPDIETDEYPVLDVLQEGEEYPCPNCGGRGWVEGIGATACHECGGSGCDYCYGGAMPVPVQDYCPYCGGSGLDA